MDTKWISRSLLLLSLVAFSFFISPQARATHTDGGDHCFCTTDHDPTCCNDDNSCTNDSCDPHTLTCVHSPNNDPCNDNDACTEDDACSDKTCQGTLIPGCKSCTENVECQNGTVCDGTETCGDNDTCEAGTPLNCDDGDSCTDDSCNAVTGCQHVDNGSCNGGGGGGGFVPNPPPVNNPSDISGSGGCSIMAKQGAADLRGIIMWFALAMTMGLPLVRNRFVVLIKRWRRV
jgi:slime mold repeat-containing protein